MVLKFVDLFAGIGGFHIAFHNVGCKCVFASEIDKYARQTYQHNLEKFDKDIFYNGNFNNDILQQDYEKIPDFDILCAGFPCQSFSQIGYGKGFAETKQNRGNMFFILRDIIKIKRPKCIFLENVRHLLNHDGGKTFAIIKDVIENELGYNFTYQIVFASDYGVPQHRPRLYMVGFRKEDKYSEPFVFPPKQELKITMDDIWGAKCNKKVGFTLRVGGSGGKIDDRRNWDCYLVDGKPTRLGPEQGKKMQGFPEWFEFPVSRRQAMKQLGNSVAVPAVQAVAEQIIKYMKHKPLDKRNKK